MADNRRKKKADGKRVALKQDYEREYLDRQMIELTGRFVNIAAFAGQIERHASEAARTLNTMHERLRAGSLRRANREGRRK